MPAPRPRPPTPSTPSVYLGFEARADDVSTLSYYAVPEFESTGGRSLAERMQTGLAGIGRAPARASIGVRHQVLRETRMPAVLASLGSVRRMVDLSAPITAVVRDALAAWAAKPL